MIWSRLHRGGRARQNHKATVRLGGEPIDGARDLSRVAHGGAVTFVPNDGAAGSIVRRYPAAAGFAGS